MVKLTAIGLLKSNGPDKQATLLGIEADLSTFGFFQRGTVREMLTFVSRTAAQRTLPGQRQTVQHEEYFCNIQNRDGLVAVCFVDSGYPSRAAFGILAKVLDEYSEASSDRWRSVAADTDEAAPVCKSALTRYQDPAVADKLTKIQRDLDDTKVVLHQTIESMLNRGERLENLVDKSSDLSMASQMFYKQARKTNSCCRLM